MSARNVYRRNDGKRCIRQTIEFYPSRQDLIDAVMVWSYGFSANPLPKTQREVLAAYTDLIHGYGLQDVTDDLLELDVTWDDHGSNDFDTLRADAEQKATDVVDRLFPTLKEN